MRTDEPARLDLLRGLEQVLGPERASTLMTYLPRTDAIATREDVRRLERRMDERFEAMQRQMDERFEAMQRHMDERFEAMQRQMDERFEAMQRQMDERFEAVQSLVDARFESLRTLVEERSVGLAHQVKGGNDATAASLRGDMNRQTRTIVFALVGAIAANASLVLLAT